MLNGAPNRRGRPSIYLDLGSPVLSFENWQQCPEFLGLSVHHCTFSRTPFLALGLSQIFSHFYFFIPPLPNYRKTVESTGKPKSK